MNIFKDEDWEQKAIEQLYKLLSAETRYDANVLAYYLCNNYQRQLLKALYIDNLTIKRTAILLNCGTTKIKDDKIKTLKHYYALYYKINKAYNDWEYDMNEES